MQLLANLLAGLLRMVLHRGCVKITELHVF